MVFLAAGSHRGQLANGADTVVGENLFPAKGIGVHGDFGVLACLAHHAVPVCFDLVVSLLHQHQADQCNCLGIWGLDERKPMCPPHAQDPPLAVPYPTGRAVRDRQPVKRGVFTTNFNRERKYE